MPHRPRKRFGQHFLHDPRTVERIVAAVTPAPTDTLVEIGPGEGVLTAPLLAAAGELHAVELDRDLAAALRARPQWQDRLHIHAADALAFDFAALAPAGGRIRIIGNLPYNISTPILFHLLTQRSAIADMHFMLQREVVARITAGPQDKAYGRLSVMLQADCHCQQLFRVAAGAFRPPPAVESAVVRLVPRTDPIVTRAEHATFAELVRRAFSARRKTLRNALRGYVDEPTFAAAGIDADQRAERLAVADFARLARARDDGARGGTV